MTDHIKVLWLSAPLWMRITIIIALLWAVYKYFSLVGILDFLLFCFLLTGTVFALMGVSGETLASLQVKVDKLQEEIKERVVQELLRIEKEKEAS